MATARRNAHRTSVVSGVDGDVGGGTHHFAAGVWDDDAEAGPRDRAGCRGRPLRLPHVDGGTLVGIAIRGRVLAQVHHAAWWQ